MPERTPSTGRVGWPAPTWVDLFYDLAFAAGIIAIAGSYGYDHSLEGALWFATVYGVLGCTWVLTNAATAAFTSRPRAFTSATVVLLVVQMAAVLLLAVSSDDTIADSSGLFDVILGVVLVVCLVLALRAHRFGQPLPTAVPVLVAAGVVSLGASLVLPNALAVLAWLVALVAVAVAVVPAVSGPQVDTHRVAHRFGELTLIILGETLVKLVLTTGEDSVWSVRLIALAPVLVILTTTWWAYFTGPVLVTRLGPRRRVAWVAAHLPFQVALLGLAVGLSYTVVGSDVLDAATSVAALLTGPAALVAASLAALAWISGDRRLVGRSLAALALGALAVAGLVAGTSAAASAVGVAVVWLVFTAVANRSAAGTPVRAGG